MSFWWQVNWQTGLKETTQFSAVSPWGLVFLSMIIATLYFAPRMDLSRLEASVVQIQSDVALIKQDTAAIRRTQEEHGERLINIEQQMGYMYNRLNGIE